MKKVEGLKVAVSCLLWIVFINAEFPLYELIQTYVPQIQDATGAWVYAATWGAFFTAGTALVVEGVSSCQTCIANHNEPSNDCSENIKRLLTAEFVTITTFVRLVRPNGARNTRDDEFNFAVGEDDVLAHLNECYGSATANLDVKVTNASQITKRDDGDSVSVAYEVMNGTTPVSSVSLSHSRDGTGTMDVTQYFYGNNATNNTTSIDKRHNFPFCAAYHYKISYCVNDYINIVANSALSTAWYDTISAAMTGYWHTEYLKLYAPTDNWLVSIKVIPESWADTGDDWEGCDTGR